MMNRFFKKLYLTLLSTVAVIPAFAGFVNGAVVADSAALTGTKDVTQLSVKANSTQTSAIAKISNDDGSIDYFKINANGTVVLNDDLTAPIFHGDLDGNADTVTNGIYSTDTSTVTNTMLAGSIANNKLLNSSITINGNLVSLGGSTTVSASTTNPLTISTGLQLDSGSTFDGSAAKTLSIDSTVATFSNAGTFTNKILSTSTAYFQAPVGTNRTFRFLASNNADNANLSLRSNQSAGQILDIPDVGASDSIVTNNTTATLTNKTLTSPAITNPTITSSAIGSISAIVKKITSQTADIFQVQDQSGSPYFQVTANGTASFLGIVNSDTWFQSDIFRQSATNGNLALSNTGSSTSAASINMSSANGGVTIAPAANKNLTLTTSGTGIISAATPVSFPNADGDKLLLLGDTNRAKIAHNSGFEFANYAGSTAGASSGKYAWYTVNGSSAFEQKMALANNGSLTLSTGAVTAPTATTLLNLNSATAASARIVLSGNGFNSGNSADGVAFLLGVNSTNNRQLWIGDSANLTANSTNGILRIASDTAANGGPFLDAIATNGSTALPMRMQPGGGAATFGGSITAVGSIATSGSSSGGWLINGVTNTSNTASSRASLRVTTAGSSAGSPNVIMTISGVRDWSMGPDSADSTKLKWDNTDTVGTSTKMSLDTSGNLNLPALTASQAVFTDSSKNLVSKATVGSGSVALTNAFSSYTPTIGDGTNNFTGVSAQGFYTTVGPLTFFEAYISWTGKGSASGNLRISLPSTINAAIARWPFTLGMANGIGITTQRSLSASGDPGVNYAWILKNTTGTGAVLQISECATAGEVQVSGWYAT